MPRGFEIVSNSISTIAQIIELIHDLKYFTESSRDDHPYLSTYAIAQLGTSKSFSILSFPHEKRANRHLRLNASRGNYVTLGRFEMFRVFAIAKITRRPLDFFFSSKFITSFLAPGGCL